MDAQLLSTDGACTPLQAYPCLLKEEALSRKALASAGHTAADSLNCKCSYICIPPFTSQVDELGDFLEMGPAGMEITLDPYRGAGPGVVSAVVPHCRAASLCCL